MGLTDGSEVCGLCGEWQTGCSLRSTAPMIKGSEESPKTSWEAELESRNQERSIRRAAEKRAGF